MTLAQQAAAEQEILQARARGELTAEIAFAEIYALYSRPVLGWLAVRAGATDADDLFQDVWSVFYRRWQGWKMLPEMEAPGARPVLSFLYRTAHFVLRGHRRRAQLTHSLDGVEVPDGAQSKEMIDRRMELGRCLDLARRICPRDEFDVLLARLEGVPAQEIARTLDISTAVVDHRYRAAVTRLRKRLSAPSRARRGRSNTGKRNEHA